MMQIITAVYVLLLAAASPAAQFSAEAANTHPRLNLLNIVPYPNDDPSGGWDRALELIPAGELAADEINNRTDLLPGLFLQLLHVNSESCGQSVVTNALVNSFGYLVDPNVTVVGVVGLFCSSVTEVIAHIVDHPNISLLELAGSTSPIHRNRDAFPLLFHTISSSTIYNRAMIKMMKTFGWQRVSIVHDSLGVYFISTANDFFERVSQDKELELLTQEPTKITPTFTGPTFGSLRREGGRIVYAVVTEPEAAQILCQAYKQEYMWPGYAYVFSEITIDMILGAVSDDIDCSVEEVKSAMENMFLFSTALSPTPETKLVSGKTYQQYFEDYKERLTSSLGENATSTPYANVMYDQIWAFALALNSSLSMLETDVQLQFQLGDSVTAAAILAKHLMEVSFQGASGYINFTAEGETEDLVNIYQVKDGKTHMIFTYNPSMDSLIGNDMFPNGDLPADKFDSVTVLLPKWLSVIFLIVCCLCYILTTANLTVYLYWRDTVDIRATSPFLSLLIFTGCYMLYTAGLMRTLYYSYTISSETLFVALANSVIWLGSTGLNFIFATLLVKLLRIYHVFRYFGQTSKYWSDPYLFLGSLLLCLGGLAILSVWTAVDTGYREIKETYVIARPQPYYRVQATYTSDNFVPFCAAAIAYSVVIISLVAFLGFQTRKIKRKAFKDTKKVNAYIASTIVATGIALPSYAIFTQVDEVELAHVSLCSGFILIAGLCQAFLFAPKTVPLLRAKNRVRKPRAHKRSTKLRAA